MKALFKHSNGRLKTSRIAFLVFLFLLICLSFAYKIGKSADKVMVNIEHVFEAEKKTKLKEPIAADKVLIKAEHVAKVEKKETKLKEPIADVNKTMEYQVPAENPEIKPRSKKKSYAKANEKQTSSKTKKQALVKVEKPVEDKTENSVQKSDPEIKTAPVKNHRSEKKSLPKVMSKHVANNTSTEKQPIKRAQINKITPSEKDQSRFALSQDLKIDLDKESMKTKNEKQKTLKLSSKKYFEVYKQWQEQGENMDKEKALVGLRILNLENVYDLFQMKAVVIKEGVPHTDLEDNSRIAKASLSEFSSTCFIVNNPWGKWGHALRDAGFSKKDNIEVWYYTYEFVRNSIYARALKAFEWCIKKQNLPKNTDPSTADVLGRVYAINKDGGGAFGVFVPLRVDFQSHESVKINPLICFKGQKDIQALNNAGLLKN